MDISHITQKYSKIIFEYEYLAIFAGNRHKYLCPPLPYKYDIYQ